MHRLRVMPADSITSTRFVRMPVLGRFLRTNSSSPVQKALHRSLESRSPEGRLGFVQESFNDDSLLALVVSLPHLLQVEHHVHEHRLFVPCEAESALEIQLWIAAHQNDGNAKQADTIIFWNEVPNLLE